MGTHSCYSRKGNSSILTVLSCDLIDPRSCFPIQTERSHFTHELKLLSTDPSREGVSVSPVVIIHFQITVIH